MHYKNSPKTFPKISFFNKSAFETRKYILFFDIRKDTEPFSESQTIRKKFLQLSWKSVHNVFKIFLFFAGI